MLSLFARQRTNKKYNAILALTSNLTQTVTLALTLTLVLAQTQNLNPN